MLKRFGIRLRLYSIAPMVALATAALLAQDQQRPPVFRSGVELVTLDVIVVDKDGKPARGLTAEDFVVRLDGEPRRVQAVDFLEFGAVSGSDVTAAPRETTTARAQAAGASRGGRVMIVLFDDLSYGAHETRALTVMGERLLAALNPDDLVGLATTSGLGPAIAPTRDREALTAAMNARKLAGHFDRGTAPFYISLEEAIEIDRDFVRDRLERVAFRECPEVGLPMETCALTLRAMARGLAASTMHRTAMQMAAYQHALTALRAAPAPRVLVVLSSGLAASFDHDLPRQLDAISQAASESGVQLYALINQDDPPPASIPERADAARLEQRFLTSGTRTMASAAGGEAFPVIGTPDRFLKRIASETSGIYRLGVEAPPAVAGRRYLDSRVSVRPPGLTVRVNRQTLVPGVAAANAIASIDERLRATLAQGGSGYGVPIAMATALRRDEGGELQIGVNIQVPATTPGPLVTMFALVDEAGAITRMGRKDVVTPPAGADYVLALPVPVGSGRQQLRLAVADANGSIGSLVHPVAGDLARMGSFLASDIFTSWEGATGEAHFLALELVPADAITLRTQLELYPQAAAPDDVVVRIQILRIGEAEPILEEDLRPSRDGRRLTVTAEWPVADLESGTYTIRATVIEAGTPVGTVSTTVRRRGPG